MPYGDKTANVGVREEVESHIDLILREVGEMANLARRRVMQGRSDHLGSWCHDPFERHAHLRQSVGGKFSLISSYCQLASIWVLSNEKNYLIE